MRSQNHAVDTDILIIEANEDINDDPTEGIIEGFENQIKTQKRQRVIIDCTNLQFLSSFGLGMILRIRTAAKQVGGEVKLAGVSPMIQEMLRVTKMTQHFMLYPDADQARDAFRLKAR